MRDTHLKHLKHLAQTFDFDYTQDILLETMTDLMSLTNSQAAVVETRFLGAASEGESAAMLNIKSGAVSTHLLNARDATGYHTTAELVLAALDLAGLADAAATLASYGDVGSFVHYPAFHADSPLPGGLAGAVEGVLDQLGSADPEEWENIFAGNLQQHAKELGYTFRKGIETKAVATARMVHASIRSNVLDEAHASYEALAYTNPFIYTNEQKHLLEAVFESGSLVLGDLVDQSFSPSEESVEYQLGELRQIHGVTSSLNAVIECVRTGAFEELNIDLGP